MNYEVILAPTAVETFDAIYDQIEYRFGKNIASQFHRRVIHILDTISSTPFIFKGTRENPNIRKGWIHKNCSVFYESRRHSGTRTILLGQPARAAHGAR